MSETGVAPSPTGPRPSTSPLRWWWMWAAVAWTVVVWGGRIRNATADRSTSATGALVLSAVSLVLAAGVAIGAIVARDHRGAPGWLRGLAVTALAWTAGLWAVRLVGIATAGHEAGFVAVHVVLGVVSVALWAAAVATAPSMPPVVTVGVERGVEGRSEQIRR